MVTFRPVGWLALAIWIAAGIWAQPPVPPPLPDRMADVKRKLEVATAADVTAERALAFGRSFLGSAVKAKQADKVFQADRLVDAADAMARIVEHQERLRRGVSGPPPFPPLDSMPDRLQHVYFRVQQADYFLKQSADSRATAFPKWARDFYQLAVRGYEQKNPVAADENAKCAEDVVKCLEDLAQAATLSTPPPPPTPPPPGEAPK